MFIFIPRGDVNTLENLPKKHFLKFSLVNSQKMSLKFEGAAKLVWLLKCVFQLETLLKNSQDFICEIIGKYKTGLHFSLLYGKITALLSVCVCARGQLSPFFCLKPHRWRVCVPVFRRSINWWSPVTVWVLVQPQCWLSSCAIPSPPCSAMPSLHQGAS